MVGNSLVASICCCCKNDVVEADLSYTYQYAVKSYTTYSDGRPDRFLYSGDSNPDHYYRLWDLTNPIRDAGMIEPTDEASFNNFLAHFQSVVTEPRYTYYDTNYRMTVGVCSDEVETKHYYNKYDDLHIHKTLYKYYFKVSYYVIKY